MTDDNEAAATAAAEENKATERAAVKDTSAGAEEGAEPEKTGAEAGVATEGEEGVAEAGAKEGEEAPAKPKQKPWWQKRIDEVTREKHEERRAREALQAQLEAVTTRRTADAAKPEGEAEEPRLTAADVERLAEEKAQTRAREIATNRAYDEACNSAFEKGVAEVGEDEFQAAVKTLQTVAGDRYNANVLPIAMQTDAPHKVLFALGSDPDEAERILSLPPVRMAIEMDRLAMARGKGKAVSKAPAPIRTVETNGTLPGGLSDALKDEEWIERRNKQVAERDRDRFH